MALLNRMTPCLLALFLFHCVGSRRLPQPGVSRLISIPDPNFTNVLDQPDKDANGTTKDGPTKIIESFHVKSDIRFRFATTQMVSVVRNVAEKAQEISFDVTLPKEAFIVNFSMAIDGQEYVGEVKEKTKAKEQYQRAVEQGQSAGHVRQAPRHSNVFQVSVNVANGTAVTFTLTYQELLRRKLGNYQHEIHVSPGQAVEDFSVEIFIQENRDILFVRTPALRTDVLLSNEIEDNNELAFVERPTSKTAHIMYAPTLQEQGDGGVSGRFAVQYDVEHSTNGDLLVADGYFLHFFAPNVPPMPKDIIFVLDVSGSMSGRKIEQLIESMVTILKDLRPEDRFNILTFSSSVSKWKDQLAEASGEVVKEALAFVRNMIADGGTNVNDALQMALYELRRREFTRRVGMIFFLTDGQPTSGVTRHDAITANVREANEGGTAIFGLAFGDNADFGLLKTISGQNNGFARKIYEAADSALQVASLYDEISAVAMTNLTVEYLPGINKTTDTTFPIIFNGTEVVICGTGLLPRGPPASEGLAASPERFVATLSGLERSGEVDVVLDIDDVSQMVIEIEDDAMNPFFTMPRDYTGIIEKMWAFLTIKQLLLEKEKLVADEGRSEELNAEILELSVKYNFVTPLTSMVVTKPEQEEDVVEEKLESGLVDADLAHSNSQAKMMNSVAYYGRQHQAMGGMSPPIGLSGSVGPSGHRFSRRRFPAYPSPGSRGPSGKSSSGFYPPAVGLPVYDLSGIGTTRLPATFSTTTTTTTAASVATTKRPRKTTRKPKGPRNKGKKNRRGALPILSSLVVRSNQSSVCLATRGAMLQGSYTLLESLGGHLKVELTTSCLRKCRILLAQSLNLTADGDRAVVQLASTRAWRYTQGQNFTARLVGSQKLVISTPELEAVVTKNAAKRKVFYDIELVLRTDEVYRGLLGETMRRRMKAKRGKKSRAPKRTPKVCLKSLADFSLKMKKKFANNFYKA